MLTIRTDISYVLSSSPHADIARMVVNARSVAEMQLALGVLRTELSERELLDLANLRESVMDLPEPPFRAGAEMSILERAAHWRRTGASCRTDIESSAGTVGIEFLGDGNRVDAIVLHTPEGSVTLPGADDDEIVPGRFLDALLEHRACFDALVEALHLLGVGYLPRFHMSLEEFTLENVADSIAELNGFF